MVGTWTQLKNQPTFHADTMFLLTDGTVMCQDSGTQNWWKLTPDAMGNYLNGTWTQLASMMNAPLYYASAVLADGRVFVAGGEYNNNQPNADLLAAEIYDPVANTWTSLPTPQGWTHIGDAPCCLLPDGAVLLGSILNQNTAIYDPGANTWTPGPNKNDLSSTEETWTLLPDGTVLTIDCSNPVSGNPVSTTSDNSERYVAASNAWVSAGTTPVKLVEAASKEIGPAILLPDGRVFAIGATGNTALYTMPASPTEPGTWAAGPTFPPQAANQTLGAKDAPACLLPNGKVLCVAGPVDGRANDYLGPCYFFEFDPVASAFALAPSPPDAPQSDPSLAPYTGRLLLLPTGQVLFSNGTLEIDVYTPDGAYSPSWQPTIVNCPTALQANQTYTLSGTQLNGLSQAVSYGDDVAMATNYPLVRIQNSASSKVVYCRTFNHSTMGVATGNTLQSTQFTVPPGIEAGFSQLVVIANGIPSVPFAVTIG